jgi:hypothetical protein
MGLLDDEELFAKLKATPRNQILGLLSDFIAKSYSPERTQQMQGVSKFMGAPAISETLDRLSYGQPLTTGAGGLGGTTRIRPEALEAAMAVAPMVRPASRAAGAGARALGPTAVGMGERYLQRQGLMPGVVEGSAIPGRDVITPQSKKELKSLADSFAEQIRALGFDAKVEHSGSKAGASSYINVSDSKTGRFLTKPIRISDHSKGPFESQNVINILNPEDDFPKVFEELNKMRAMGESLVFKQQKYAQSLIDDGVKPKVAYQRAKDEVKETLTSTLYPAEERMANPASGLLQDQDERKKLGGLLFR